MTVIILVQKFPSVTGNFFKSFLLSLPVLELKQKHTQLSHRNMNKT